jgi:hypothetical protein
MLTPELLADFKSQYDEVYQISTNGIDIVFRPLTYEEFDAFAISEEFTGNAETEDLIVEAVLLHPDIKTLQETSAGVITGVCEEVIEQSGFFNVRIASSKLEEARERASDVRFIIKSFILSAIPSYHPDDLDKKTFKQLCDLIALSEQILELKMETFRSALAQENPQAPTLILIDEEAEQSEQERKNSMRNLTKREGAATANDPIAAKLHSAFG